MGKITAVFDALATCLQAGADLREGFGLRVEAVHTAPRGFEVHDIELLVEKCVELV